MISLIHFPEQNEKYSEESIARMAPKKREKALAHIEKMKGLRDRQLEKMRRLDAMAKAGECYCDGEYRCGKHEREWWEQYCERVERHAADRRLELAMETRR